MSDEEVAIDFTKRIFSLDWHFDNDVQHVMVNAEDEESAIRAAIPVIKARKLQSLNVRKIEITEMEMLSDGEVDGGNQGSDGGEEYNRSRKWWRE